MLSHSGAEALRVLSPSGVGGQGTSLPLSHVLLSGEGHFWSVLMRFGVEFFGALWGLLS